MKNSRRAFTLVELLVVIGIIAVLIAILLPALGKARRAASTAKCAASLKDLGNAFQMYAIEYKGYFPPAQLRPAGPPYYTLDATQYPFQSSGGENLYPYWFNFIQKYVTKGSVGVNTTSVTELADARLKTVIWGCPEWTGIVSGAAGDGINRVQVGYAMNIWPTFSATHPRGLTRLPPATERSHIEGWPLTSQTGRFTLAKTYQRQGDQRILLADSRWWALEADLVTATAGKINYPAPVFINSVPSYTSLQSTAPTTTSVDLFRHGKAPPLNGTPPTLGMGRYQNSNQQRISYNALWCDGHVTTENDIAPAYKGLRMRLPG